jgi:CHRD domain-containing protein
MRVRLVLAVLLGVMLAALTVTTVAVAFGGAKRVASMNGAEECNAAGTACNLGDPDGTGSAQITLNVGHATVCWATTVANITLPATASHIHEAPVGRAGPIVVPLSAPDASGHASGCTTADPELIQAIVDHPEEYYVNVHTTDFPAGAIRGQLSNRGQSH